MMRFAAAFSTLFVTLALGGMAPARLETLGLVTLAALILGVAWDIVTLLVWWLRDRPAVAKPVPQSHRDTQPTQDAVPPNAIIVDGSNVMHWGGEPSLKVLIGVTQGLIAKGLTPVVVFDASVGHRLMGRYLHGHAMADLVDLPRAHVYVVHKGVVADEVILDLAQDHGLRVVSNDRYRDWSVRFPIVKKKGRMMRGAWDGGNVVWVAKG